MVFIDIVRYIIVKVIIKIILSKEQINLKLISANLSIY